MPTPAALVSSNGVCGVLTTAPAVSPDGQPVQRTKGVPQGSVICQLRRNDNDPQHRTGLVRDAKHPLRKKGNDRRFKYTPEAWEIAERQPNVGELIFPHKPQGVSSAFTRACKVLGIEDLTFHDLRHEAISRLFERGYTIPQVAQFTLHESWNELSRYTHLLPNNLRDLPDPTRVATTVRRGEPLLPPVA
jgi:integrase